jgi:subtilase family serine protease
VVAPDIDASVPAELGNAVLGVTGLDNAPHYEATAVQGSPPPPTAFVPATPCSQFYGQLTAQTGPDGTAIPNFQGSARAWANCGYLPQQLNATYGGATNHLDGTGVTVAITLWYSSPTQPADENHFDQTHGFPMLAPGQYTVVPPNKPYHFPNACGSAQDEQSIDITSVHNVAPAANILYYAGASCGNNDMLDALARVVDDDKASIVTNSWGGTLSSETTGDELANEQIYKQGALQGQAFLFSSGDNGDWVSTLGHTDYDYPASDPWVTSVGGTTLNLDAGNNVVWQAGWGYNKLVLQDGHWVTTGFGGGAGGGFAPDWARPGYQHGVVRNPASGRAYPDIAALADTVTGIRVGFNQVYPNGGTHYSESRYGGTSVASPLMAGEQALAEQALGGRVGFANPLIYSLARAGSNGLDDVTGAHDSEALVRADFVNSINAKAGYIYSVRTIDDDSSLHTATGWDDVTGVGTPNAGYAAAVAAAVGG